MGRVKDIAANVDAGEASTWVMVTDPRALCGSNQ